jgi:mannose-6-phosphate isomerase-like protein (cupin superfamily)
VDYNFEMATLIRAGTIQRSATGSLRFEGVDHGGEVSFFLVHNTQPGTGAKLHRHPYSETWIVQTGHALFNAGGKDMEAGPGDMLVVEAGTAHKFTNLGPEALDLVCIHAAPKMVQEDLE